MSKKKNASIFERHEKKYRLNAAQGYAFLAALGKYMTPDEYGLSTLCSLYCDAEDYRIIRASREKPAYKEKIRLRSYGVPDDDTPVFLELKKKLDGVVYKRRVGLPLCEAEDYLSHGEEPSSLEGFRERQIFSEIDWFCKRHNPHGRILLCADRIALLGRENPSLRITLDYDIRWRDYDLSLGSGDHGEPLLAPGESLMEVKTTGALPLWLCELLTCHRLFPQSFSKVGAVYEQMLTGSRVFLPAKGGLRHAG